MGVYALCPPLPPPLSPPLPPPLCPPTEAVVVYDYQKQQDDEVDLVVGSVVLDVKQVSSITLQYRDVYSLGVYIQGCVDSLEGEAIPEVLITPGLVLPDCWVLLLPWCCLSLGWVSVGGGGRSSPVWSYHTSHWG